MVLFSTRGATLLTLVVFSESREKTGENGKYLSSSVPHTGYQTQTIEDLPASPRVTFLCSSGGVDPMVRAKASYCSDLYLAVVFWCQQLNSEGVG